METGTICTLCGGIQPGCCQRARQAQPFVREDEKRLWHIVYTEEGVVREIEFIGPPILELAEAIFATAHPKASYWEMG